MSGRFAGRNIIVTGGGRGIGQAAARQFAAEGGEVLLLGRTAADLDATVAGIEADGGSAWSHTCDVRDDAQVDAAIAAATDRWGRIDVLVNNAGIDDDTPFLEIDRAKWRSVVDTNLTGCFLMAQLAARSMAAVAAGRVDRCDVDDRTPT